MRRVSLPKTSLSTCAWCWARLGRPRDEDAPMAGKAIPLMREAAALSASHPLIRGEGLRLEFDDGRTRALDGLDFHADRHEFVAVTGPSGCGKSSLMSLVGLLDIPTAG